MPGTLGTRIKRARERKRMRQRELAAALGVSIKTVDNWENDRTSPRSSIGALEAVLGVSLAEEEDGRSPPDAIDRAFGDRAADFRDAMGRVFGADAGRKLRLVEEALRQAGDDGAPPGRRARPGPR